MTKREFLGEFVKLAAALKQALSDPLQDVWWEEFAETPVDVFRRACIRARRELDFFPSVREMRGFIGVKPRPPDPALVRLLTPWTQSEPWPADAPRLRLPRAAPAPMTDIEKAIRERMLNMGEVKHGT